MQEKEKKEMLCPGCRNVVGMEDKFCRKCGMTLQGMSQKIK